MFWLLKQHLQKSYLHQICCFDTINPSCSIFWFNISIILMKKWTTCSCTCSFFKTILNNQKMAFSSYIFGDFVSQCYHLFIFWTIIMTKEVTYTKTSIFNFMTKRKKWINLIQYLMYLEGNQFRNILHLSFPFHQFFSKILNN